jgi:trehalose synthase
MVRPLENYLPIVGEQVIDELYTLASHLKGRMIQNINSTAVGGGVAEILHRMVPLLNELGLQARWDVMKGGDEFFFVTKAFHNALHGESLLLTTQMKEIYMQTTARNLKEIPLDGDIVFIHDPQPLGMIAGRSARPAKWIWRCHIDLSAPNPEFMEFLRPCIENYDASVFSAPVFAQQLPIPQFLINPSIDPLSEKNHDLPQEEVREILEKFQIDPARPILTQVSRFDYLKDPFGVIEAYRRVKRYVDCQLVLAGGTATDDPESEKVLPEVRDRAGNDPDIHILLLPPASDRIINALQRSSWIVLQKSLKEGFGLAVSEAMWKGKPVVGSAVGGIPLQVKHRVTGMLVRSIEGAAQAIKYLLANPEVARKMGNNGREHVRQNFLLTRHLKDYLLLFLAVERGVSGVTHL